MKTTTKFLTLVCLTFAIALTSCSKDGEIGPAGPAGIDGIDGADGTDGTDGADGADGADGNADVIYSNWIPADFTGFSSSRKFMKIDFPAELPSAFSIKDTHVILVYYNGFGDGNVYLLPVLDFRGAQFTYGYGGGSLGNADINLTAQALIGDLTEFQIDPARGNKFRYVIIPPTINISGKSANLSGLELLKANDVDINNYAQVMDYFGLDY